MSDLLQNIIDNGRELYRSTCYECHMEGIDTYESKCCRCWADAHEKVVNQLGQVEDMYAEFMPADDRAFDHNEQLGEYARRLEKQLADHADILARADAMGVTLASVTEE
jgi:hypothetical protein